MRLQERGQTDRQTDTHTHTHTHTERERQTEGRKWFYYVPCYAVPMEQIITMRMQSKPDYTCEV